MELRSSFPQACLREIHAKMLRKHLQRLVDEPLEDEDEMESDHGLRPGEDSEPDLKGMYF